MELVDRQMDRYRTGDVAQERRVRGFPGQHAHGTRKTQLVREGLLRLPPPLLRAPGLWPCGNGAAPNVGQESPCLRSSLCSVAPALNPRVGESRTKVAEAPPNLPPALCSSLSAGSLGDAAPSLPALGSLGLEGCQEEESRSRRRFGPIGRALGTSESVLVRVGRPVF